MPRMCREVEEFVTENVERPVEQWIQRTERDCWERECSWWCLCCDKLFCVLVSVVVRVVVFVVVTITRIVTRLVCEVVSFVLDVIAFVLNLIQSIPFIGAIIRTVVNWITEIFWRLVLAPEYVFAIGGSMPEKRMYLKVIILNRAGVPLVQEADVLPNIQRAQDIFLRECNVRLIHTGTCVPQIVTPEEALFNTCDDGIGGFFSDFGLGGAYYELVSTDCAFEDGFQRVAGWCRSDRVRHRRVLTQHDRVQLRAHT